MEWTAFSQVPIPSGGGLSVTVTVTGAQQFFRLRQIPLTYVRSTSPLDLEQNVSVTRETILTFSAPLGTNSVIKPDTFYAGFGGRRILSRAHLSTDRRTATLFYQEPLPGGARVSVVFDGTGLVDELGTPLDADGDGVAGGSAVFSFDTLGLTPLAGTAVVGTVYASELMPGADTGTNAVNRPLEGVTITVDGMEESLRTRTDAMGNFRLEPVPPGEFFVHIDGRTARGSAWPGGDYYPTVGKQWQATAGRVDTLAGGTGQIFLPQIKAGALQTVSATQDTLISFLPEIVRQNPALAGVSITVPANALVSDNGTRGGKVGIAPVPPDRLPGPLPPGLEMPIVITVQTDGALNFDRPAPICFPNLPDPVLKTPLPAGSKQALISFNHDKGLWEAVGSMTVSADGKLICTDPGSGILQPGWHGVGPDPVEPPPCGEGLCCPGPEDDGIATAFSSRGAQKLDLSTPGCKPDKCKPKNLRECVEQCSDALALCRKRKEKSALRCYSKMTLEEPAKCHRSASFRYDFPECAVWSELHSYECTKRMGQIEWFCRMEFGRCIDDCAEGCPGAQSSRVGEARLSADEETIAAQILAKYEAHDALIRPYWASGATIPLSVSDQLNVMMEEARALAGGDLQAFVERYALEIDEQQAALDAELGPDLGNAPAYPVLFAAEIDRPSGSFTLRGETRPSGQYSLFVPRDGQLQHVTFYDPRTKRAGIAFPRRSASARYRMPRFNLQALDSSAPDSDGDGLPDVVEFVYGTNESIADTDGDGIRDGAELDEGTNPLDGQPIRTGIIGTVKTPGAALDVAVANDRLAVAQGVGGVSLFTLENPVNPTLVAHFPAVGNAQRIAAAGDFIAVASGEAGVHLIGRGVSATPTLLHTLKRPGAQAIAADNNLAYVGFSSGAVAVLDLRTGRVLHELSATNAVWDLALHGDHLYALTDDRLLVISLTSEGFKLVSSINSPFEATPNRRLFVGGGIAYTVHGRGYNSIDVTDPTHPVLLTTGRTTQFGWRHLAETGSGIGVAAVGINSGGPADVSLYDFSDPRQNDRFLTQFPTPGTATAVVIHNGFAYVADANQGLQVVNYQSFDTQKLPPTVTLTTSAVLGKVDSSQPLRMTANAVDDVQVRHVEFYLDGRRTFTDGSFPFEYRFNLPALTGTKTNVLLRARAIDTGGNAAWSEELTIQLGPDLTPPRVIAFGPVGGGKAISSVFVNFNEPMNPATLNSGALRLIGAGADGLLDTADDRPAEGGVVGYQPETLGVSLSFPASLTDGLYRAIVMAATTDVAGNPLGKEHTWQFRVADAVFWIGGLSGSWNEPDHWSTGTVPGPNEDVILENLPDTATVRHAVGTTLVRTLKVGLPLLVSGGSTLQVGQGIDLRAPLTLDNGTLKGGQVLQNAEARLRFAPNAANILDGVRILGDLMLTNTSGRATVRNGLELTGRVVLDNAGTIVFAGSQAFNVGSIVFGELGALNLEPGTTLTLGPGMVIHGKSGVIQANAFGTVKLINQGRIAPDVSGGRINFAISQFENQGHLVAGDGISVTVLERDTLNTGTIEIQPGGTFTWNGSWTNQGTLRLNDGTLNLGGSFTLPRLGTIVRTGGTLNLNGTMELEGGTLALNASTGAWRLDRGGIHNGTVTQSPEARLMFAPNAANTLDALKVTGDLVLTNTSARVVVRNGLDLAGAVVLDNAGTIVFAGNQAFNSGSIVFGELGALNLEPGTTLTLGPGMVIHGKSGVIQANAFGTVKLINQGRIAPDVSGGRINFAISQFENQGHLVAGDGISVTVLERDTLNTGTIEIQPGGTFTWNGSWTNQGTLRLNDGTLNLGGSFTLPRLGTIVRTGGTLNLNGTMELEGGTLALNASTGAWRLDRGGIHNGTVTQSPEARLMFAPNAANTLDALKVTGDLVLTNTSARVVVRNGLDLAGAVVLDNGGTLTFAGDQIFNSGQVLFAGTPGILSLEPGTTLTLGPEMVVRGKSGALTASAFGNVKLINQGLIAVDVPGGTLTINPTQFENTGTLRADGVGTTIRILTTPFINTGSLQEVNGGTVVRP